MTWSAIFIGITTGFLGSSIVVLFLYRLRPKIEISTQISEYTNDSNPIYGFKLINRSSYAVFDVHIVLELVTPVSVPGGQMISADNIDLINGNFFMVQKFDSSDSDAEFAFRVRTTEDIRKIWAEDSQFLRISVVGRHALSGFYGAFEQSYYTKSDIKAGSHRFGLGLDVQPVV